MALKDHFEKFQPIVVNENIILRQVIPEMDYDKYFQIYNDSEALKYYQGYRKNLVDKVHIQNIIENQIKAFEKHREYNWTIADSSTNEALGRILLSDFQNHNTMANIGYFLDRKYWGKGIMTHCVRAVVSFAFKDLKLERIFSTIEVNNVASYKVLEKNGFLREGLLRHCFLLEDGLHDCYIYGKLSLD